MDTSPESSVLQVLNRDELKDFATGPKRSWRPHLVLAIGLLILFTVYFSRIDMRPTVQMNWIMYAAEHFAEEGYFHHRFTPAFSDLWSDHSATDYTVWYTHYPPLPYYVAGLIWKLGGTTKFSMAVFHHSVALLYLLVSYLLLSLLLNNRVACIATLLQAGHAVFIAQCLANFLNLSLLFQVTAWLLLVLALEQPRRRNAALLMAGAWICLFGDAFSSFDQVLASSFFVFGYTFWRLGLRCWKKAACIVALLATASFSAFFLHLATNAWFFGSFHEAFNDLCVKAFTNKSAGGTIPTELSELVDFQSYSLKKYPAWLFDSVWTAYSMSALGFISVLAALTWTLVTWGRKTVLGRRFFVFCGILCIANLTYWTAFPSLNYIQFQYVNASQWVPTYCLLMAGGLYFLGLRARQFFHVQGLGKTLVCVPCVLMIGCLLQVEENVLGAFEWLSNNLPERITKECYGSATGATLNRLRGKLPPKSVIAIGEKGTFSHLQRLRPHESYCMDESPFPVVLVKPSDKNALFKFESGALVRDVFFLVRDEQVVIDDNARKSLLAYFTKAGLPESDHEDRLLDSGPTTIRPNWTPYLKLDGYTLYKVAVPEKDDLFPERATMPTRMAVSGIRLRDGNELQIVGWLFSGKRITHVELSIGSLSLGRAVYPAPSAELMRKQYNSTRVWFGMNDYPLPNEEFARDYPEYGDTTHRFILIRSVPNIGILRGVQPVRVRAYSGDALVIQGDYSVNIENGTISLIDKRETDGP